MNETSQLIDEIINHGCDIKIINNKLHIENGHTLSENIKEMLIRSKRKVISSLNRDNQARSINFLVGITGQMYCRKVSISSMAFIEVTNDKWSVWRETHQKGRIEAVSVKNIAIDVSFSEAIAKARNYFNYMAKMRMIA